MRIAGITLITIGIIGMIVFGVQAMNDADSFNFLGLNIAVSKADWTPVIISFGIAALGVIVSLFGKRKL